MSGDEKTKRLSCDGPATVDGWQGFISAAQRCVEPVLCPNCGGKFHRSRRRLRFAMVSALRFTHDRGMVTSAIMKTRGDGKAPNDWTYLKHWGLLEVHDSAWKVTPFGRQFLAGTASVPEAVFLENGEVVGVSEERVTIQSVCEDEFSLSEVLAPFSEAELANAAAARQPSLFEPA